MNGVLLPSYGQAEKVLAKVFFFLKKKSNELFSRPGQVVLLS